MNILLVNTNQISIRFVEELLAKNNIHGEIAMVRAGKFALDLVQGMHVDLLVCEIESETKEKAKHFLSESRKMTPDAYYFVLMDGESLEYMEEAFLNSLDDFITIPFEDRALKLRLNRGILACIEKKKKAGIIAGRPSARMAETMPEHTVPVEIGETPRSSPEKPLRIPEPEATPSPSSEEPAPAREKDSGAEKPGTPGRRIPREEFQYEPSYEELLQQRNRILRKEKEAAWLQAMSSQISSYALDEEMEKPLRIREERKPEPMVPSSMETISAAPAPSVPSTVPEAELPDRTESLDAEAAKPAQNEVLSDKDKEPSAETPKAKSVVKSLFESLSKLKVKTNPPHLEPLLASAENGSENTNSTFDPEPEPHTAPSYAPSFQPPDDSPARQPIDVSEEPIFGTTVEPTIEPTVEPATEPIVEPADEPKAELSPEPSAEMPPDPSPNEIPDSEPQDEMESGSVPDIEDSLLSDDRIPEESFLDYPISDEEYVQEIPPLPDTIDQDVTEAVPEETLPIIEEASPLPEGNAEEPPVIGSTADETPTPVTSPADDRHQETPHPEASQAIEETTGLAEETHHFEEVQHPEEPVENLQDAGESLQDVPVAGDSKDVPHDDEEDRMPETDSAPPDVSGGPLPDADFPSSRTGRPIELNEDAAEKDAEEPGESQASPIQVPHLQDEIWLDPTEPFILEPDESVDNPDAPLMDLIEEVEIFGIEEDVDISLAAEEDPLLEEDLILPFEEDPWRGPETVPDPLQDSGDGVTFGEDENREAEDPPMPSDDLTSSPAQNDDDDSSLPEEGIALEEKPDDRLGSGQDPLNPEAPVSAGENPEERIPEEVPPEPVKQDPIPQAPVPKDPGTGEAPVPEKKESLDLRQYLKEPQEEDTKGLKNKFRKTFGKKSPS